MPKTFLRIVGFLHAPCLVADPIFASVFSYPLSTRERVQGEGFIFIEQALTLRAESGSGNLKPRDVAEKSTETSKKSSCRRRPG